MTQDTVYLDSPDTVREAAPAGLALPRVIESLLFVSDGPIELTRLQKLLAVGEAAVEAAIDELAEILHERGVRLQRHAGSVQLVTAPESSPYVEKLLGVQTAARLSPAALETLSIIAYRQPITRAGIEAIRGVNSDRALATLQNRELVAEVGRLEAVGRPILYGTTFAFLQHFGLSDLANLPPLEDNPLLGSS